MDYLQILPIVSSPIFEPSWYTLYALNQACFDRGSHHCGLSCRYLGHLALGLLTQRGLFCWYHSCCYPAMFNWTQLLMSTYLTRLILAPLTVSLRLEKSLLFITLAQIMTLISWQSVKLVHHWYAHVNHERYCASARLSKAEDANTIACSAVGDRFDYTNAVLCGMPMLCSMASQRRT